MVRRRPRYLRRLPAEPPPPVPRRGAGVIVSFFFFTVLALLVLVGGGALVAWNWADNQINRPVDSRNEAVKVVVKPQASLRDVAHELHQQRLVDSELVLIAYARYHNLDRSVQAGSYTVNRNMNMVQLLETLQHSRPVELLVTIPEGYTSEKAATALEAAGLFPAAAYLKEVKEGRFDDEILKGRPAGASLEGYLFPDTYLVPRDATPHQFVALQLKTFAQRYATVQASAAKRQPPLTTHQLVTLASIIEREVQTDQFRPNVASVLSNRLTINMPLQADATVLYAMGVWKKEVLLEDLKYPSPYNTYLHAGLPPGPISNPGLKALQAAADPPKTDYYFYFADKNGVTHFSRTNEEHESLKRRYGVA
jgi:UPF0755 protein